MQLMVEWGKLREGLGDVQWKEKELLPRPTL